jgi:hypothetical protein
MDKTVTITAAGGQSWKWQLRDRLGQWIEMGSTVKWLANGLSRSGKIVGSPKEGVATVEEDKTKRRIDVPASRLTAVDSAGKPLKAKVEQQADAPVVPDIPEDNVEQPVAKAIITGKDKPAAAAPAATRDPAKPPVASNPEDQGFFDMVWNRIRNFRKPDGSRRPGREDGTGTEDDPIFVGNDVNKAVDLLLQSKHIRMSDEDIVPTVVKKLGPAIKKKQAQVDAMPDGPEKDQAKKDLAVNLCAVHVPGTNLFCVEHKGIPRIHMPQLSGKDKDGKEKNVQDKAVEMLESMNLIGTDKLVNPEDVRASQSELGAAQIDGMVGSYLNWLKVQDEIDALPEGDPQRAQLEADRAAKMADPKDYTYMSEKVLTDTILTTKDKYIIDGHHRWAAMVLANIEREKQGKKPLQMKIREVDMEVGEALATVNAFADAAGIQRKAPSGAGNTMGEVPKILRDSKVRAAIKTWIEKSLMPISASAVQVGDLVIIDGELREILGVIAETSGGRSFIHRSESGPGISILRSGEQVTHVHTL